MKGRAANKQSLFTNVSTASILLASALLCVIFEQTSPDLY